VILVEGPAELFLIAPLVKAVLGKNLDEEGISVIPIHGAHFGPYTKLFGPAAIQKKCAILTDGDSQNEEKEPDIDPADEADAPAVPAAAGPSRIDKLKLQENALLKVFVGDTTFEMELTDVGTLGMFSAACADVGAPRVSAILKKLEADIGVATTLTPEQTARLQRAKKYLLSTSKRFQKGRFAQTVSKHAHLAKSLPSYIKQAVAWVTS
jgi:putative ATP-dependent endonuclease of OLD family